MSWVTVIWSATAGICLTLAVVHLFVWLQSRSAWPNFWFSLSALAAASSAAFELLHLRAETPEQFGAILRWSNLSYAVLVISLVWFIRLYMKAGRAWLAWLIAGLDVLGVAINLFILPNSTFQHISEMRNIPFLGEPIAIPVGMPSPLRYLAGLSVVLFLVYALDATITAWRQKHTRRPLILGGTISIAAILIAVSSELMVHGLLPGRFIALIYLFVVLAMAFELSADLLRTNRLATSLQENQLRVSLAMRAADLSRWEWDIPRDEIRITDESGTPITLGNSETFDVDHLIQSLHPDDRESIRDAVHRLREEGGEYQVEFRILDPSGACHWIALRGQVENDASGKPLRLRGVSRDITERKKAEEELRGKLAELAHLQRLASMGELSATLAHELNQPLGAILRNTEAAELFLKQEPPDLNELQAIVTDIKRDEQRAAAVIDRMRALMKRRDLSFEVLAVDELIRQVAGLLRAEFQVRHARLNLQAAHDLPKVYGDRVHLQQVILNLLLNSLDALDEEPNAQRQVTIRASQPADGIVEVEVTDQGAGIPPDQLPNIFEPFFTTKSKGAGIGLAISRTIIELHEGRIWAENNPDGGAMFRFTLKGMQTEGKA
jgi:two-component system sensor kinase FixL